MKVGAGEAHAKSQPEVEASSTARRSTRAAKPGRRWRRFLAEPLVHFIVVGVVVFGAYSYFHPQPQSVIEGQKIVISADDVRQLVVAWLAQGRPPLTQAQLQSLIDQKVAQEVLFREGQDLGLDRDDEIIKRRVAQKMDFLAANVASLQEPETSELMKFFAAHTEQFALPPHMNFRQVYFSPDQRGSKARADAQAALSRIAGTAADSDDVAALGDPISLRGEYTDTTPEQAMKEFGPGFSAEIFKLKPGVWRGPIQSGYGWHLVWVEPVVPGRVPRFDEVEADVKTAWRDDQFLKIKRAAFKEMRARYTVVEPPLDKIDLTNLLGTKQASVIPPEFTPQ